MMDWTKELQLLVEAEYHSRPVVAGLATVGTDGSARGRMVIVRRIDENTGEIWSTTDGRSAKCGEMAANSSAELVFWSPHERMQFRVRGAAELLVDGETRSQLWRELSEASRATFLWPEPGAARSPDAEFAKHLDAGSPIPHTFTAIVLRPHYAESLELNYTPHRRRRWTASNQWLPELINP